MDNMLLLFYNLNVDLDISWFWKFSYEYMYLCVYYLCVNYLCILIVNGMYERLVDFFSFIDVLCIMIEFVFVFNDVILCCIL